MEDKEKFKEQIIFESISRHVIKLIVRDFNELIANENIMENIAGKEIQQGG